MFRLKESYCKQGRHFKAEIGSKDAVLMHQMCHSGGQPRLSDQVTEKETKKQRSNRHISVVDAFDAPRGGKPSRGLQGFLKLRLQGPEKPWSCSVTLGSKSTGERLLPVNHPGERVVKSRKPWHCLRLTFQ